MLFADTIGKPEVAALTMGLDSDTTTEELVADDEIPVLRSTDLVELASVTRGIEIAELAPVPRGAAVLFEGSLLVLFVLFDPEIGAPPAQYPFHAAV